MSLDNYWQVSTGVNSDILQISNNLTNSMSFPHGTGLQDDRRDTLGLTACALIPGKIDAWIPTNRSGLVIAQKGNSACSFYALELRIVATVPRTDALR